MKYRLNQEEKNLKSSTERNELEPEVLLGLYAYGEAVIEYLIRLCE